VIARRPRICHVWDAEYPWDIRVEKISRALNDAGFGVDIIARNRRMDAPREDVGYAVVHRLAPMGALPKAANAALMFPAFFNPLWFERIRSVAIEGPARVILCRDIPLAPTCIAVARALGIPVVLDIAEHYPAMIREKWEAGRATLADAVVRNPRLVSLVERWAVRRADHLLVVVEESAERLRRLGVLSERMTVVSNTPPLSDCTTPPPVVERDPLRVVYLGLLEEHRGVGTLIDAAALLRNRGMRIEVDILGDGREASGFRERTRALDLDGVVRFHGYVANAQAKRRIAGAHIGVVPHFADESWNHTISNKLFDYMAAGLAVVSSDAVPSARVMRETNAGRVFRSGDATALAGAIAELADDNELRRCSANARRAIRAMYHWEADAQRLVSVMNAYSAAYANDNSTRAIDRPRAAV
jgi:glycosyltransferase involved in cell wall biosynthesis